jgi:hypothetical protein
MTVKIQLDAGALDRLFPEGSEARADLARGVAVSLCEKLAIKEVKHLSDGAKQAVTDAIRGVCRDDKLFLGYDEHTHRVHDNLMAKIRIAVRKQVDEAIAEELRVAVRDSVEAAKLDIAPVVQSRLEAWMTPAMDERLRQRVAQVLTNLISPKA